MLSLFERDRKSLTSYNRPVEIDDLILKSDMDRLNLEAFRFLRNYPAYYHSVKHVLSDELFDDIMKSSFEIISNTSRSAGTSLRTLRASVPLAAVLTW